VIVLELTVETLIVQVGCDQGEHGEDRALVENVDIVIRPNRERPTLKQVDDHSKAHYDLD
jgi:hypothetical protein